MSTSSARKLRPPRLSRRSNGRLMTPEEFDAVTDYDDNYEYELVHGVLIVSPFAGPGERDPNEQLGYLLRLYEATPPGPSPIDATLSEQYIYLANSRRRADRVIWIGLGRLPDPEADVPAIAIEFVSKSSRDRIRDHEEKRREYLAVGVKEYWLIDRFARTMTVFRPAPAAPEEQVFAADSIYRTPLLPGFELGLQSLLARANAWKTRTPEKPEPR